MNDYISLRIDLNPCTEDSTDLLASFLADSGFESFEPDSSGLTAYIRAEEYVEDSVKEILSDFPIELQSEFSATLVEGEDWNEKWEKNYFQPIVIDDRCVIHSSFHKDLPEGEYEIVIDPKMAFGTGHHATTSMMVRQLLRVPLSGKWVIDMGAGTGILSILAKMLGAESVVGIEIDPAAYENAHENVKLNNVEITILEGDSSRLQELQSADIFLANINRNVILADLSEYVNSLKQGGLLILSGFYESDVALISRAAEIYDLQMENKIIEEDGWTSLRFRKD